MSTPPTVLVVSRSAEEGERRARELEATGHVVCLETVAQRADIVRACQRRQPHVVLIDLRRPDGLELVELVLRESPRPVVALSDSSARASAARDLGAV